MNLKTISVVLAVAGLGTSMLLPKASAQTVTPGHVKVEVYRNISGTSVANLTSNPAFPNNPSDVYYVNSLEYPDAATYPDANDSTRPRGDVFNNYGIRISGFIVPKQTADYVFYLAADDNAQFFLSTDENPANAKLLATEPSWNPVRAFTSETRRTCVTNPNTGEVKCNNVSDPVRLEANKRYYFYGLMKEGGGGDNYAVAWTPRNTPLPDPATPIAGEFLATAVPAQATILGQPKDAAVLAGSPARFSVGLDLPPSVTVQSIKWTKNGADIPGADSANLSFTAAAADDNAKIRAVVTTSQGVLQSNEATLTVAELLNEFALGVVKFEAFTGISGTAVDQLLFHDKYINNTPDDVRLLSAIDTPNGYGDNYGARVTGVIIPPVTGDYNFFTRSDDASQFYLNTTGPAIPEADGFSYIAVEFGCCGAFMEPDSGDEATTQFPIRLEAGKRYGFNFVMKEGGGGDWAQVAMRREGDTTPANALRPLSGSQIGANAKITKAEVNITKQPAPVNTEEGRTLTLSVDATTTPTAFNLPLLVQWQKNGQDIAGATGRNFTINEAKTTDTGKYRAVLNVAGVKSVNSAEVDVSVVPDTSGPLISTLGAVRKGANMELGITFDEKVDPASASAASAYTVSKGTISSVRLVPQSSGAVLVVSGLNAGDSVTVTAKNLKDLKGNVRDTTSKTASVPAKPMTWVGVGGNEMNESLGRTDFVDDVVARSEKDFDLISGGSAHWTNYDEQTFVYEEITGDFDKVVRVEYQDPVTQWSRAGLDAREALDEGKTRADIDAGYKFSQHFTIRVNPPAVLGWDGRTGNNAYEVIHRPVEGRNYDGFNAMFNIQAGGSGVPAYPNAWLRLKREGQKITAFRSDNGQTWTAIGNVTYQDDPDSEENEVLADKLFVGMFWAPEFGNIAEGGRAERTAAIAKFRDYGDFGAGPSGGEIQNIQLSGANVVITFTGSLEQADSITGPWTAVTGSSPLSVPISGKTAQFFRVKK